MRKTIFTNLTQRDLFAPEAPPTQAVVIDCETTGFHSEAEVIQVTILSSAEEVLLDTLIRPRVEIDPYSQSYAVNRISQRMVKDAPSFAEVYPRLHALLDKAVVIAYNTSFDRRMIEEECRREGLPLPVAEWRCAMTATTRRLGRRRSLTDACQHFGVEIKEAHTARGDAIATLALSKALGLITERGLR